MPSVPYKIVEAAYKAREAGFENLCVHCLKGFNGSVCSCRDESKDPLAWRLEWRDGENAPGEWEYEETVDMESEADRYVSDAPPGVEARAIPLYPADESVPK